MPIFQNISVKIYQCLSGAPFIWLPSVRQERNIERVLFQSWASVADDGPALKQHWCTSHNLSCLFAESEYTTLKQKTQQWSGFSLPYGGILEWPYLRITCIAAVKQGRRCKYLIEQTSPVSWVFFADRANSDTGSYQEYITPHVRTSTQFPVTASIAEYSILMKKAAGPEWSPYRRIVLTVNAVHGFYWKLEIVVIHMVKLGINKNNTFLIVYIVWSVVFQSNKTAIKYTFYSRDGKNSIPMAIWANDT